MAHKLAHERRATDDDPPRIERDQRRTRDVTRRGCLRLGSGTLAAFAAIGGGVIGVEASTSGVEGPRHRIRIHGTDTPSTYELTVVGELTADGEDGRTTGHVSGTTAEGAVTGGDRAFLFRGELVDLTVDGDAEVSLDGRSISV